jgi:hypothetical protein
VTKVDRAAIEKASQELSNWGRRGKNDQVGTLNSITPDDIIPAIGISMGGIFYPKELVQDCLADHVYEFIFTAPPLHLPGGPGRRSIPQAIK